eukprot:scaffold239011_cov39-Prasinocladus_malaysianus.AAC.3
MASVSQDAQTTDAQQEISTSQEAPQEKCLKYFDALWFCYSPVHQMTEYYRYGVLDSCQGHWSDFMNCMARKTKFGNPAPPPKETGIWQLRTPEEAAKVWRESFPADVLPQQDKPEDS